jgi:hypothetical protein
MHSLLGACALEENNVDAALVHYQQSHDLSHDAISKVFALSGLLRCHANSKDADRLRETTSELLRLAKQVKLPDVCAESIVADLERVGVDALSKDGRKLQALVQKQLQTEPTA